MQRHQTAQYGEHLTGRFRGNILPETLNDQGAMHFRIRKQVVQLVRMNYDAAVKRGRAEVVGSVKLSDPILPEELRHLLTAQEVDEFDQWVATQYRSHQLKQELAALSLAEQIDLAKQWFEAEGNSATAKIVADETQRSWKALRKKLMRLDILG